MHSRGLHKAESFMIALVIEQPPGDLHQHIFVSTSHPKLPVAVQPVDMTRHAAAIAVVIGVSNLDRTLSRAFFVLA